MTDVQHQALAAARAMCIKLSQSSEDTPSQYGLMYWRRQVNCLTNVITLAEQRAAVAAEMARVSARINELDRARVAKRQRV